jgi:tetratricopeptide (TPR) repeat protein
MLSLGCWTLIGAEHPSLTQARRALSEGIPQVAIHTLSSALATPGLSPAERPVVRRLLAEAHLSAGDSAAALETLSTFPEADSAAALLRAHAFAAEGRWSEALPVYQSLNGRLGVPSAAAVGEAESLQAVGQTAEAIAVLERLVRAEQAGPAARLRLAALLLEVDRGVEARAILKATPPGTPGDENWRRYIEARILLLEKNTRGAFAILDSMLRRPDGSQPENLSANLFAAATLALAETSLTPDNPEPAIKILETFIRKNPDSPQIETVFRRLDQLYARDRTPQEGVMQNFVRDLPPRVKALARLYITRMQMREKNYVRASLSIRQFLSVFPDHPLVPYMYMMRRDLELAGGPPYSQTQLAAAEAALDAASLAAKSDELKAELALRTALINLWQGEFVRAVNHLKTAKELPRLRTAAKFDSALAWLMQENHPLFEKEFADFMAEGPPTKLAGHLRLEQGLVKARAEDPAAGEALQAFLREFPAHPRRLEAELALAERAFLQGRPSEAIVHIQAVNQGSPSAEIAGQAEYLAIFLEDAKQPRNDERVIALARAFIDKHPKSTLLTEVRMKLGQVYFQREDYLNAQEQFETLAAAAPDSPSAETALFLAGQCGTKLFNAEAHKRALELFGKVAERKGSLEPYARLQQAILKSQLGAEDDAVKTYDSILVATVPAEVRYAALVGKGDNLAALAKKDPKQAAAAIAAYEVLLAIEDANPMWRNQAAYKKARVLQQIGRKDDALVVFNEILDMNSGPRARETFWLSRAGFEAAALLEAQQQWKGAIGIYEKMSKIPGAHVEQARQRVKALRSMHFIWD